MSIYSFKHPYAHMEDNDIKKIYVKRRKLFKTGHCVRCGYKLTETRMHSKYFPERNGELIAKGGIMKDKKCPSCGVDLMEFCFQDLYDEAKSKAKEIKQQAKFETKSETKSKKKVAKKKVTKKVAKKPKKDNGQNCLF